MARSGFLHSVELNETGTGEESPERLQLLTCLQKKVNDTNITKLAVGFPTIYLL